MATKVDGKNVKKAALVERLMELHHQSDSEEEEGGVSGYLFVPTSIQLGAYLGNVDPIEKVRVLLEGKLELQNTPLPDSLSLKF